MQDDQTPLRDPATDAGAALRRARQTLGLSQAAAAYQVGHACGTRISQRAWSEWEAHPAIPPACPAKAPHAGRPRPTDPPPRPTIHAAILSVLGVDLAAIHARQVAQALSELRRPKDAA
jgi:hypothetical protein